MMNREDLLKELELLPVWQLNNPLSHITSKATEAQSVVTSETEGENVEQLQKPLRLILSGDKQWLFLLSESLDNEAEQLLQNMLKAIDVSAHQDTVITHTNSLMEYPAKVMVVMGESEAQQLLNDKQTITELRGKTHLLMKTPVVVTYSVQYLLENLSDKAMAWEDLCLAKLTIANL